MKTTKYKSVKNRKRALHLKQRAQYIPSKGNRRFEPPQQNAPAISIAALASLAFNAMRRPFRRQSR
jgi:hypothetical protein